jgi:NAD(P)-dependent dehydrogenase (short-subunit alcohol dehydrogenase family)
MRILVTGASRGLGREFVRQYAAAGHQVFAASRSVSADIAGSIPVQMEVTDPDSIAAAFDVVRRHTRSLDLLINNAGIYSGAGGRRSQEMGELTADDGLLVFRTNSLGPILTAQQFLPLLRKGEKSKLISLSSSYGSISGNSGQFPYHYSSSKAALNQYMRSFAFDKKTKGIISVVISPGWVQTDMGGATADITPEKSVDGMIRLISLLKAKDNGTFVDYRGIPLSW